MQVWPVWQRNAPLPLGTPLKGGGSARILFIHDLAVRDGLRSAELVAVGLRVGVDWTPWEELSRWFFYTNNDAVWRLRTSRAAQVRRALTVPWQISERVRRARLMAPTSRSRI